MKKIREDKPIGVLRHINIELSQGNSLCKCRYLYLKQAKMSYLSFCSFSFFFYKIREQKDGTIPYQGGGLASVWGGGGGKGGKRVNMVQKMCMNVCECKDDICCNYSISWGWG
jgi:hypothetical protein